jgi:hypothetical protein
MRWIPLLLIANLSPALAQDSTQVWTHTLVGDVTANQVGLKDWSQGGDNAFAWGYSLNGSSVHTGKRANWETGYKLGFGQNKLGDQDVRKTVDKFEFETAITYRSDGYIEPYIKATLKSQLFRGHQYDGDVRTAVSGFFDPAYMTQSAGGGIQPLPELKTRAGLAVREIVTSDFTRYADDESTADIEKVRVDGGLESVTDVTWQLAENTRLTSKLEIFLPLTEIGDTSVGNDATLVVKLSEYITLNLNLQVLNDPTSSDDVQLKQTTALGINYSLF